MPTVRELMDLAQQRIEENTSEATSLGAVYKFVLDGDGGGTFLINMKDEPGVTEAEGAAQCTIKMGVEDFVEMVETKADPRQFFFMGKLKVEGNFGLAIKLRKLTDMFR